MELLGKKALARGAMSAKKLEVGGPFHTTHMAFAKEEVAKVCPWALVSSSHAIANGHLYNFPRCKISPVSSISMLNQRFFVFDFF